MYPMQSVRSSNSFCWMNLGVFSKCSVIWAKKKHLRMKNLSVPWKNAMNLNLNYKEFAMNCQNTTFMSMICDCVFFLVWFRLFGGRAL